MLAFTKSYDSHSFMISTYARRLASCYCFLGIAINSVGRFFISDMSVGYFECCHCQHIIVGSGMLKFSCQSNLIWVEKLINAFESVLLKDRFYQSSFVLKIVHIPFVRLFVSFRRIERLLPEHSFLSAKIGFGMTLWLSIIAFCSYVSVVLAYTIVSM